MRTCTRAPIQCAPTYPRILHIPTDVEDSVLEEVAKYRQGGRLPNLAYVHDNKVCVGIVYLLIVRACVRAGMYV